MLPSAGCFDCTVYRREDFRFHLIFCFVNELIPADKMNLADYGTVSTSLLKFFLACFCGSFRVFRDQISSLLHEKQPHAGQRFVPFARFWVQPSVHLLSVEPASRTSLLESLRQERGTAGDCANVFGNCVDNAMPVSGVIVRFGFAFCHA